MSCVSCGSAVSVGARYCSACGHRLTTASVAPTGAPRRQRADPAGQRGAPVARGDRRIVTALFADLVDYVRMLAEYDPEEVRDRVTAALATMSEAIERLGGTREKFIGDAVFAVFGWPQAHDDDAVRAAIAALAIRSGLQDIGDGAGPLEVRIGLATGEVVAAATVPGPDGDMGLTGEAITTAARIQSLARPGEILLDGATLRAARDRLTTEPSGAVVLRGQAQAVELYTLHGGTGIGLGDPVRPIVAGPLIGREAERASLVEVLEASRASGTGGVVVVVGEAGVGKSRLLAELEPVAAELGFRWTWTENVSYGRTEPYRYIRLFAQAIADEHGVDSGTLTRRLLFTDDLDPATVRRFGGAIAAIARDASFTGWEAEASDMPSDPAEVAATLIDPRRSLPGAVARDGPGLGSSSSTTCTGWTRRASRWSSCSCDATRRAPLVVLARHAVRGRAGRGSIGRMSSASISTGSMRRTRPTWRPSSRGPRSTPTGRAACTSGRVATRCS